MTEPPLAITAADQLVGLLTRFGRGPLRIRLDLPGLAEPARSIAEQRLASALSACGCTEGAVALLITLGPAAGLAFWSPWSGAFLPPWALFAALLVAASLAGKALGLLRARRRLKSEIARIVRTLPPDA